MLNYLLHPYYFFKQLCLLCLLLPTFLLGQADTSPEDQFEAANNLYTNEKFPEALKLYKEIWEAGLESKVLHYNLGNTYLKADSLGKAIVHYERALRLAPRFDDAQQNLDYARKKITVQLEEMPVIFYKQWWRTLINFFSSFIWALLTVAFLWLALLLGVFYFRSKNVGQQKRYFTFGLIALTLSFFFLIVGFSKYQKEYKRQYAILTNESAKLYSGPSNKSESLMDLSEGIKVKIITDADEWAKVLLPDSQEGWIAKNKMEII